MFTLFHHPFCPHSRFIRLALGEHGLDLRLVEERVWERREAFLALNPAGTTPVLIAEGRPRNSRRRHHRRISRRDPRRRDGRAPAVADDDGRAHRGAPADGVVQREILRGGLQSAGHRAHLQALHERGRWRRRAGGGRDPRGEGQCALSSGLYRLAGADAELSRRRPADLCGPRRRGASFGDRLSGRRAMDRGRRGKGVVRAGEVPPLVPPAAERMAGGRAGVARPMWTSISDYRSNCRSTR